MFIEALKKVTNQISLTEEESQKAFSEILDHDLPEVQVAAFLAALRGKGETADEILGCVRVLRHKGVTLSTKHEQVVDTCGTGADQSQTFNISTAAAFVAAGAGLNIAKHGNRSVSSLCGSADVLEALGIPTQIEPANAEIALNELGITFLFAPKFHPVLKKLAALRRQLGIKTIFNIAGPLANPVRAKKISQVLGVFEPRLVPIIAEVLNRLGVELGWVVHSQDGLDEISNCDETEIASLEKGEVELFKISPESCGYTRRKLKDLRGKNAEVNAQIILNILNGEKGAQREVVVMNAAAACVVGKKALTFSEGVQMAEASLDSSEAKKSFLNLKEYLNK